MSKKKQKRHIQKNVKESDTPMQETKNESSQDLVDQVERQSELAGRTPPEGITPQVLLGDPNRTLGESTTLPNCYDKLAVRQSPLEGFGVFATDKIPAGTILEETPVIVWPQSVQLAERFYEIMRSDNLISEKETTKDNLRTMFGLKHPTKYYFKWFPPNTPREGPDVIEFQCLPLGYGPIYNSANGINNAIWEVKEKTFIFRTIKDVEEGEEIQTFYGYMVAEDGTTFNVPEVLGLGLELAPSRTGDSNTLGVYLRSIRFSGEADKNEKLKSEGYNKIANALAAGGTFVKLNKITAIEDDGTEKHPFDFPETFPLKFSFMKLQEFKQTRFKQIKIYYSYVDSNTKKEIKGDAVLRNPNV
jgi:hypothetical protein